MQPLKVDLNVDMYSGPKGVLTPRSQKIRELEMKLSKTKAVNTQLEAQVQKHQEEAQHAMDELNQSKALLEGAMKLKEESSTQMQTQTAQNSNEMMKLFKAQEAEYRKAEQTN